eukprot:TRINITY_DN29514_c0_g1_i1.p1 TRINITY_DN29514_c0_g1~~TRINITY_DN29514_c0_g1_i1.p1  ORF type:complete len:567 (+),score=90.16 TRINITY_DN29514_c0_g1_i1:147-1703(+)
MDAAWVQKVEALQEAVHRQQRRAEALGARQQELSEEHQVLCECLEFAGVLQKQSFLTLLHRRRFAQVLREHPLPAIGRHSFEAVTRTHELALLVTHMAGPDVVGAVKAVSRAVACSVASVTSKLSELFPSALYVVGGAGDGTRGPLALAERLGPGGLCKLAEVPGLSPVAFHEPGLKCLHGCTGGAVEGVGHRAVGCSGCRVVSQQTAPLNSPRACCAVVAFAGHIYAIAGHDAQGVALSSVERYDPRGDRWCEAPKLLRTRGWLAAVATAGVICALGGEGEHVTPLDDVERLDARGENWEPLPPMREPRWAAAAATVGGFVYVTGGYGGDDKVTGLAERFALDQFAASDGAGGRRFAASSWEALPPLRCARAAHAMATVRGKIYVVGGYDSKERGLASIERFDPITSSWEALPAMGTPRWGLGAVGCGGRLFVVGGKAGVGVHGVNVVTVRCFDPQACTWQTAGRLRVARRCLGAALCRGAETDDSTIMFPAAVPSSASANWLESDASISHGLNDHP